MTPERYVYPVTGVVRVLDGDTYWVTLDVGFRQVQTTEIRLAGWDTPELHGSPTYERDAALRARDVAVGYLSQPGLWVRTEPDPDSFGRWLGHVWSDHAAMDLGHTLESLSLATPWPTRWREGHPPPT